MFSFGQCNSEIAVFDLETTFPPYSIIEVGIVVLDKLSLNEKESW
jgi:hypothetical protein